GSRPGASWRGVRLLEAPGLSRGEMSLTPQSRFAGPASGITGSAAGWQEWPLTATLTLAAYGLALMGLDGRPGLSPSSTAAESWSGTCGFGWLTTVRVAAPFSTTPRATGTTALPLIW